MVSRSPVPVSIARLPEPIQNTSRILLAVTDADLAVSSFQQTLDRAKSLAEDLKASLQVLLVVTKGQKGNENLPEETIDREIPIVRLRGNFASQVSQQLLTGDLLILTAVPHHNSWWYGSGRLKVPEAIVRAHPNLSTIVFYFPV